MEIYKTKQIKRAVSKIAEICEKKMTAEVCGIIGSDSGTYMVQECKNISDRPSECFVLDPIQYLLFKEEYEIVAIFHSHIIGDESPSEFDIMMSENSCVPFIVYSLNTKNINVYTPKYIDSDEESLSKIKKQTKQKV